MPERRLRSLPEPESIGRSLDLSERLRLFDIGAEERDIARQIWAVLEPEARTISQEHWRHWHRFNEAAGFIRVDDPERLVELGIQYLRSRYTSPGGLEWVLSAERTVAAAMAAHVPLTAVLAMTSAGASVALEILGRRHECSKEERHRINDVFTRLRSLECDVYSSVYAGYIEFDAASQRESLGRAFDTEVATTLTAVAGEGEALQSKAALTATITRSSLEKVSQVAAASAQSALTMREAASAATGLIKAIDEARSEVETAAEIATRAAEQAGAAVGTSEKLSDHARSIESILGLIRDIAGQTNLLALNATIEAARAGDAGRGFSVVAQEVKSLAHQTARATDDIAGKIAAIQTATRTTVSTSASIRETVAAVQESADRIRAAMEMQAQTVSAITTGVGETALAAESISDTIGIIRADTESAATEIETVQHDASRLLHRFHDLTRSAATFTAAVAGYMPAHRRQADVPAPRRTA